MGVCVGMSSLETDIWDEGSGVVLIKEVFPGNWQRSGEKNRTEQRRNLNQGVISGKDPQKWSQADPAGDSGVTTHSGCKLGSHEKHGVAGWVLEGNSMKKKAQ